MRQVSLIILTVLLFGAWSACDHSPVFPVEPQIEFVDIHPRDVEHLRDSIGVTFRFQDGDGDLGSDNNEDFNLWFIDMRYDTSGVAQFTKENLTIPYSLMNLTPDARKPSIQGEVSVELPVTINTPGFKEEFTRYEIILEDRAGNRAIAIDGSDRIFTEEIRIWRN